MEKEERKHTCLKDTLLNYLIKDDLNPKKIVLKIISLRPLKVVDSEKNTVEISYLEEEVNFNYEFEPKSSYALILKWNFVFKKVPNSAHDYYFDIEAKNYR